MQYDFKILWENSSLYDVHSTNLTNFDFHDPHLFAIRKGQKRR